MEGFGEVESLIDNETVLVTDCPPFPVLDVVGRGGVTHRVGSKALPAALERRPPRLHLFGHSHSSVGIRGSSINGSCPNVLHFFGIDTESGRIWVQNDETR